MGKKKRQKFSISLLRRYDEGEYSANPKLKNQDKRKTIRMIADFLGKDLSENEIDKLEDYLSFEKFKNNKTVNHVHMTKIGMADDVSKFMRRGKPGGWRELIDEEMEREFNRVMEEKLKGTDLRFPET